MSLIINYILLLSHSCGVQVGTKLIVSGGLSVSTLGSGLRVEKKVYAYDRFGKSEKLSSLKEGRWDHACATYINDYGNNVR